MSNDELTESTTKDTSPLPKLPLWTWNKQEQVRLRMTETGFGAEKPITLPEMLMNIVNRIQEPNVALAVKREGTWTKWSYKQFHSDVLKFAKSLIKLGLGRFDGVGLLGFNSPEWFIGYMGAVFAGGVSVGIYTTNSAETTKYVAMDSGCHVIVVDTDEQMQKVVSVWDDLPNLKAVVQYTGKLNTTHENVYMWQDFLALSADVPDDEVQKRLKQLAPNSCCGLIYTSGTTGPPKAAMFSHDNATWTSMMVVRELGLQFANERLVSYLPLSHIGAQMLDILVPVAGGLSVYFAQPDALKGTLGETWKEVKPTGVFGVPRVWEKVMERLQAVGRANSWPKQKIAQWAKNVGLKGSYAKQNGTTMPACWSLANKLVLTKVAAALGLDRCRQLSSLGAPISWETTEYFASLDMQFMESYGSSECCGPVTFNKMSAFRLGSVGRMFPGSSIKLRPVEDMHLVSAPNDKLGEQGEMVCWGRNVFMGYLSQEEKTRDTFTEDGYFRTGDVGAADKDGFWYITGRIKELIITAGGENIAPVPIEEAVKNELPCVSHCMVIGDRRKFLCLLITLKTEVDPDTMIPRDKMTSDTMRWCKSVGSSSTNVSDIIRHSDTNVVKAIQAAIDRANQKAVSRAAKIQKWSILPRDFSVAGEELVPAMKMKRATIEKMYKKTVDAFYQE